MPPDRSRLRQTAERVYRLAPTSARPGLKAMWATASDLATRSSTRLPGRRPTRLRPAVPPSALDHPSVTVVIPAKDEQEHVADAVRSVLEQSVVDVECLVVDDGSLDFTIDRVVAEADGDPRVRIVRHERARGLAAARNTGLAQARGTYTTFLDGDDYLFPGGLAARLRAHRRRADDDLGGVYCDWMPVPQDDPPRRPDRPAATRTTVTLTSAAGGPPFIATAPLLRTDLLVRAGGFDETFDSAEDFELWTRLLRLGFHFDYVPVVGVAYRQRRGGMVQGDPAAHAEATARVLDALASPLPEDDTPPWAPAPHVDPPSFGDPPPIVKALAGTLVLAHANGHDDQIRRVASLVAGAAPVPSADDPVVDDAMNRAIGRIARTGHRLTPDEKGALVEAARSTLRDALASDPAPPRMPVPPRRLDVDEAIARSGPVTDRSLVSPVTVGREAFGGVVLCPLARYHTEELVPLARSLEARGHRTSFLLSTREAEEVRQEMRKYTDQLFSWPDSPGSLPPFEAVVMLNDWGPTKELVALATARGVPSFSKVEGVQDFEDVDTGRIRKPYRWADHVLCQGRNDVASLDGAATHIVGNSRLERIALGPENRFGDTCRVVVNSNFTYSVLTDERGGWLRSVLEACTRAGVDPIISQHHADASLPGRFPIATEPMKRLLVDADVLVSRFSTVPFEAMARGVPFVYHNPHHEKVPTFARPDGAFEVSFTTDELAEALRRALARRGRYRAESEAFFAAQVDVDPATPSEERSAAVIDRVIRNRPRRG